MAELLHLYGPAVSAVGVLGVLMLVQVLVVDVLGIRACHAPGHPVTPDPADPRFRAVRALANTNESVAIFLLLPGFAIATATRPWIVNRCAEIYVAARLGHMGCDYAGLSLLRSVSFVIGLVALVVLAFTAWFSFLS